MASGGGPAADQTADLMKNLTLESETRTDSSTEAAKKPMSDQNGPANGGAQYGNGSVPSREQSMTPLLDEIDQVTDVSMCYLPTGYPSAGYVYGGYDGSVGGWEDYSRYISPDGVDVTPGVYGDMYHHGYGYAPYGSYAGPGSTVPTMGHDAQLYGQHHYQYPASYYQGPASASYMPNQTPTTRGEVSTSTGANQSSVSVDTSNPTANATVQGNANASNVSVPSKPNYQNTPIVIDGAYGRGSMPGGPPTGYQDHRYGFDGMRSPVPWFDGSLFPAAPQRSATPRSQSSSTSRNVSAPSARSQSQRPHPHVMGLQAPRTAPGMGSASPNFLNKMFANNRLYGQLGNTFRTGFGYGPNSYHSKIGGNWSEVTDSSYKTRGRGNVFYGNGNENQDGFTEVNRGPRSGNVKIPKPVVENAKEESSGVIPNMEQYNREDFPENYSDAKFYIIKSYSEDDIHRSVKYSVWASTPNGNTKLDNAYKEAQKKAGVCPVFLFFSVNTSGQFVGVAEMVGPVDFEKTLEYWQQDKWFGYFPVKWHIVKDVPNPILKHITLENNDNKPVTNSRDTQEVKLEQGLKMLKLFKEHVSKTSILDDFDFYEKREKMMQERKAKQKQIQKQGLDGKTNSTLVGEQVVVGVDATPNPHNPSILSKESFHSEHEEHKASEGTSSVGAVADDAQRVTEPATEHTAEKGAASG